MPWLWWLIVLGGPAACAAAGAGVTWLWQRGTREGALDRAWDEGYERARYDIAIRYDQLTEQGVQLHHHSSLDFAQAQLEPADAALAADLALVDVRDQFDRIREQLGLADPAGLAYAEQVAHEGLIVDPVGTLG